MLVLLSVLGLLLALGLQGCLFGGGGGDESAGGEAPPPEGGPGEMPPGEMGAAPPGEAPPPEMPGGEMPPEMAEGMPGGEAPGMMGAEPGMMGAEPAAGGEPAGGGDASAMVSAAMQAKHAGDYAEARARFEAAVAADPSNLDAHWGLAWIYAEMHDAGAADMKDRAVAEFNQVLQLGATGDMADEANAALERLQ